MVIDDDDFSPCRIRCIDGDGSRRATIDGKDQARAIFDERPQRLGRWAIALSQAVGDEGQGALAVGAQIALDQGDRSRAIDIVVAEQGDPLPCRDCRGEAHRRPLHVLKSRRVRQQRAERRVEIVRHGADLGATRREHAPEQLRKSVDLRDRAREMGARRLKPLNPAIAARRTLDAKQGRRRVAVRWVIFEGCRHAKLASLARERRV